MAVQARGQEGPNVHRSDGGHVALGTGVRGERPKSVACHASESAVTLRPRATSINAATPSSKRTNAAPSSRRDGDRIKRILYELTVPKTRVAKRKWWAA